VAKYVTPLLLLFCVRAVSTFAQADETYVPPATQKMLFNAAKSKPTAVMSIRLYSQILSIELKSNLVPIYQAQSRYSFMIEEVPFGETAQDWSRMFTIVAVRSVAQETGVSAESYAKRTASNVFLACPKNYISKDLGYVPGTEYPSYRIIFGCAILPKNSVPGFAKPTGEMTVVQAIQGKNDMYSVQFAMRGPSYTADRPLMTDEMLKIFLSHFDTLKLCDPEAQREPCKSVALLSKAARSIRPKSNN
jgi:hypothetical protein